MVLSNNHERYKLKVILFNYGSTVGALGQTPTLTVLTLAGLSVAVEQPHNLKGNSLSFLSSINHAFSLAQQSGFDLALIHKCPYLN